MVNGGSGDHWIQEPPAWEGRERQLVIVLQEDRDSPAAEPVHLLRDERGDQLRR
ncbi:hypothetical protein GCM10023191_057630 [Actinoallomurus oryzae]|uniref:Uncharacterized protein n=1 Tax=Actinoallomurus oryzae TaxID=502180 RepID=A0ABP8QM79_9ACTN